MPLPPKKAVATHSPKSKQTQSADKQSRSKPGDRTHNPGSRPIGKASKTSGKAKARKKAKLAVTHDVQPACPIVSLPFELLAEVLSYTSPRDILALARTNKFFCDTLVKNSSTFIWKKARERCQPMPLPDPTPNFTEPSYAAFLFDAGTCEACGNRTNDMYASFALRLRLCQKELCMSNWRNLHAIEVRSAADVPRYRDVTQRVAQAEIRDFGFYLAYAPNGLHLPAPTYMTFRRVEWEAAVDEYNKADSEDRLDDYKSKQAFHFEKQKAIHELALRLANWRNHYRDQARERRTVNLAIVKTLGELNGWQIHDVLQSPSLSTLFLARNKSLEEITPYDLEQIKLQIDSEMVDVFDKRKRKQRESVHDKQRIDVAQYHETLKRAGQNRGVLPTLPSFRTLPTVQLLQNQALATAVYKDLAHSPELKGLIEQDLLRWSANAKASFGALLGFESWATASKAKLHPVDRLNARFRCLRCDSRGLAPGRHSSMNFVEACGHVCKRKQSDNLWKPQNFAPDSKAIMVVDQLLALCGTEAEAAGSLEIVKKVGTRIVCRSCTAPIVMNYELIVAHCSRHDDMRIELLPQAQADALIGPPIEHGAVSRLTEASHSAKELREKRIYGCRHCTQAHRAGIPVEGIEHPVSTLSATEHMSTNSSPAESSCTPQEKTRGSQTTAGGEKRLRLFSFDGLRSHAKEKHGIDLIGDEDFFKRPADDSVTSVKS